MRGISILCAIAVLSCSPPADPAPTGTDAESFDSAPPSTGAPDATAASTLDAAGAPDATEVRDASAPPAVDASAKPDVWANDAHNEASSNQPPHDAPGGDSGPAGTDAAKDAADAPSCNGYQLTQWPVALANIQSMAPLGLLVPPDHTFPSPHMGIATKAGTTPISVVAPASLRMTRVMWRDYDEDASSGFGGDPFQDVYTVSYELCGVEVQGYIGLITSVTHSALLNAMKACVPVAVPGVGGGTLCQVDMSVSVKAGEEIGVVKAGRGLDIGFRDYRNPTGKSAFAKPDRFCAGGGNVFARCYTACALEYLPDSPDKTSMFNLLLDSSRTVLRTEAPRCGSVYHDVVGSAQGNWFAPVVTQSEGPQLYLGPSTFTDNVYDFSIGTSVPSVTAGLYRYIPSSSGTINRKFSDITNDDVYCFETFYRNERDAWDRVAAVTDFTLLVQRRNSGASVAVERRAQGTCGTGPWTMSAGAAVFDR